MTSAALAERKVVVQVVRALGGDREDPGERVVEDVRQCLPIEWRVGGQAAAPLEPVAVPVVMVDGVEAAPHQRDVRAAGRVDAGDAVQLQGLAGADVELPIAAVPVAGEDHLVAFADVQPPVAVEPRVDAEPPPVEGAFLGVRCRDSAEECGERDEQQRCRRPGTWLMPNGVPHHRLGPYHAGNKL